MLYDVVYFCKESRENEELTYSIRSVVKNFPHNKIWVYGGLPDNLTVENHVRPSQLGDTKWDRVRKMFFKAALNDKITDYFWLFNDDFFVINKVEGKPFTRSRGSLADNILEIEGLRREKPSSYTRNLRRTYRALRAMGETTTSFELHVPFLFNRKKLEELIRNYPDLRSTRTVYGNIYHHPSVCTEDVKVYDKSETPFDKENLFLSTDDKAWEHDTLGVRTFIEQRFPEKSIYEK